MSSSFANWSSPFSNSSSSMAPTSTILQICQDMAFVLDSCSGGSQLIEQLRRTIDDVFSSSMGQQNYNSPSPSSSSLLIIPSGTIDYQAYYDLLNANGPVLRAIDRLMRSEPNVRYPIVADENRGSLSPRNESSSRILELNPFEYYAYRFGGHLTTAAATYPHGDFDRLDCVYQTLLIDYLNNFLPPDGIFSNYNASPTSSSNSSNQTATNVDPRSKFLIGDHRSANCENTRRLTPFGLVRRELFRDHVVAAAQSPQFATSTAKQAQSSAKYAEIMWKGVGFVSILLDIWFEVTEIRSSSSNLSNGSPSSSSFVGNVPQSGGGGGARSNPAILGVTTVIYRTFVEHLQSFAYGPTSSIVDQQFRDFKERHVPKMLESRIWPYLQYAFEKWPLDSSFRLLLELWFACIQPWRYVSIGGGGGSSNQGERNYDDRWAMFVKDHSAFYDVFFRLAINRLLRMDLSAFKNAYCLWRIAHVFSQSNLTRTLGWMDVHGHNSSINLSSRHSASLDQIAFDVSIAGLARIAAERAARTSRACRKAIADQQKRRSLRKETWSTWFVKQIFPDENDDQAQWIELERAREYLDVSTEQLEHAFGFRISNIDDEVADDDGHRNGHTPRSPSLDSPIRNGKEPDCREDADGRLRLTPLGRRQLLNANRRFDFARIPHPSDVDPAVSSSMEFGVLARLLQSIATRINTKYGRQFDEIYVRPGNGVIPWSFRKFLSPPSRLADRHSPTIERRPIDRGARLNLRPLASYRAVVKFILLILVSSLFLGFRNVILIMFLGMVAFIFWVLFVLEFRAEGGRRRDRSD